MESTMEKVATIAVAIIGVATLAVLVSRNANTAGVIKAAAGGFSQALSVAISPVSGSGGPVGMGVGFTPPF